MEASLEAGQLLASRGQSTEEDCFSRITTECAALAGNNTDSVLIAETAIALCESPIHTAAA